jgi:hypothetical protein
MTMAEALQARRIITGTKPTPDITQTSGLANAQTVNRPSQTIGLANAQTVNRPATNTTPAPNNLNYQQMLQLGTQPRKKTNDNKNERTQPRYFGKGTNTKKQKNIFSLR